MSSRSAFRTALALAAVVGTSFVAGQSQAEPAALHVPGEVHFTTLTQSGLAHTIRRGDGSWDGFGVLPESFFRGDSLASTIVAGEEHVLFQYTRRSHPPHTSAYRHHIRHADGTWTLGEIGFDQVNANVAVTAVSGELHLVHRHSGDGVVRHRVRHVDGTWVDLADLPVVVGAGAGVGVAGSGGELRLLLGDPAAGTLTYYVAQADGTWSEGTNVPFAPSAQGVTPSEVDVAQVGTALHAVVRGSDGLLYHSLRNSTGAWTTFHGVGTQIPLPAGPVTAVSITASSDTLHVAVTAGTGLFHAIRLANGAWRPFGDVEREAGEVTSFGVSIAGT